jgi:heme oxygenase
MAKKYHNRYIKTMDRLSLTEEKKVRLTEIVDNAYRVFRPDNTDARPGI